MLFGTRYLGMSLPGRGLSRVADEWETTLANECEISGPKLYECGNCVLPHLQTRRLFGSFIARETSSVYKSSWCSEKIYLAQCLSRSKGYCDVTMPLCSGTSQRCQWSLATPSNHCLVSFALVENVRSVLSRPALRWVISNNVLTAGCGRTSNSI